MATPTVQPAVLTPRRSCEDAIREIRDIYQQGRYNEAAEQSALVLLAMKADIRVDQELLLLDLQCSSLLKLEDLDAALLIAKSMIRLNKQCGLGYVRIISVEKGRGEFLTALRYLDHGLARLPANDKYFSHLSLQRGKLQALATKAVITARATDPMTVLPLEILRFILSYLDYRQIIAMTRVSKSWKRVLCAQEPVIDTLDFRKSHKQVSYQEVRAALKRLMRPRILAIDKLSSSAGEALSKKLQGWKFWSSLESLVLNNAKISPTIFPFEKLLLKSIHLGLDTKITINAAFNIIENCPLLQQATFRRVNGGLLYPVQRHMNLRSLEIGNAFDLAAFSISPAQFSGYPNLHSLTVNGAACSNKLSWDLVKNEQLLKLDTYACVIRSIQLPGSLEQWFWDGTEVRFFSFSNSPDEPPVTPLPNLHTVCFSGDNALGALAFLEASEIRAGQLRRVGLHNRQSADRLLVPTGSLMLRDVEELSFESESLQDHHFLAFVATYPSLRKLQLAAPRITGAFIIDLLRRPDNQIQSLVLKDCRKIPQDTIQWARAQKVDVEVHLGSIEVRGGRRMREGWF